MDFRRVIILLVLLGPVLAFSQSRDTVFRVKAIPSSIALSPESNVLYQNITHKFKISKSAGFKIDTILFSGGTVRWSDSTLTIKATKLKTGLLKVYQKLASGRSSLAYSKEFDIRKFVEPKPNLDGVDNDSAVIKLKVIAQGYVNVPKTPQKELKRNSYKVIHFEMDYAGKNTVNTLKTDTNRLTYEMRDYIDNMPEGGVIQIHNIQYLVMGDTLTIQRPLRIYIRDDKINKF